jgi:hypothetical protein
VHVFTTLTLEKNLVQFSSYASDLRELHVAHPLIPIAPNAAAHTHSLRYLKMMCTQPRQPPILSCWYLCTFFCVASTTNPRHFILYMVIESSIYYQSVTFYNLFFEPFKVQQTLKFVCTFAPFCHTMSHLGSWWHFSICHFSSNQTASSMTHTGEAGCTQKRSLK